MERESNVWTGREKREETERYKEKRKELRIKRERERERERSAKYGWECNEGVKVD